MSADLLKTQTEFLNSIKNNVFINKRLLIYQRAYWIRFSESLKEDFPIFFDQLRLDPDKTDELISDYLHKFPSTYFSLGEFSKNFPKFVSEALPNRKELADTAELELATLLSENQSWSFILESNRAKILQASEFDKHDIQLLWNSSLIIHEERIIFQKNRLTEILNASHLELEILRKCGQFCALNDLLKYLESSTRTETEVASLFEKFAKNEILFFIK